MITKYRSALNGAVDLLNVNTDRQQQSGRNLRASSDFTDIAYCTALCTRKWIISEHGCKYRLAILLSAGGQ